MDKLRLAYIAGFLDGEGWIGIEKQRPPKRCVSPQYGLYVRIVNTRLEPLTLCQKLFGGSIWVRRHSLGYKDQYVWSISHKAVLPFLKLVCPYLIIKKRQAELGIEFQTTKSTRLGCSGLIPDELSLRETYYQQMKQLNH